MVRLHAAFAGGAVNFDRHATARLADPAFVSPNLFDFRLIIRSANRRIFLEFKPFSTSAAWASITSASLRLDSLSLSTDFESSAMALSRSIKFISKSLCRIETRSGAKTTEMPSSSTTSKFISSITNALFSNGNVTASGLSDRAGSGSPATAITSCGRWNLLRLPPSNLRRRGFPWARTPRTSAGIRMPNASKSTVISRSSRESEGTNSNSPRPPDGLNFIAHVAM